MELTEVLEDEQIAASRFAADTIRRQNARAETLHKNISSMSARCNGCGNDSDPCEPYKDRDDLERYQKLGCHLFKNCDTVNHLVESMVRFVVGGRMIRYRIKERESSCGSRSSLNVDSAQCCIDRTIAANDWIADFHEEPVRRLYSVGECLRRIVYGEEYCTASFIEPWLLTNQIEGTKAEDPLTGLTFAEIRDQAKYGVIYSHDKERIRIGENSQEFSRLNHLEPIAYVVEQEDLKGQKRAVIVPEWQIQHERLGANRNHERAVTPWHRVEDSCEALRFIRMQMRAMIMRRAEYAVIEKIPTSHGNSGAMAIVNKEARDRKKRKEETGNPNLLGAKKTTKGHDIEFPSMQLPVKDVEQWIELEERRIGRQIQMPDFITLGRSDMGSRATSDQTFKPIISRVRYEQNRIGQMNAEFLWRCIASKEMATDKGVDEEALLMARQSYEIVAEGFADPAQDIQAEHERAMDLADRGYITPEQAVSVSGHEFDQDALCDANADPCGAGEIEGEEDE